MWICITLFIYILYKWSEIIQAKKHLLLQECNYRDSPQKAHMFFPFICHFKTKFDLVSIISGFLMHLGPGHTILKRQIMAEAVTNQYLSTLIQSDTQFAS